MKNILLFTDTKQVGGAELQMLLLAKFLDKKNFNVHLICSESESLKKWAKKIENEGVKVHKIKVKSKHDKKFYFRTKKVIKDYKIDLLHAHVWNPASCRWGLLAAKSSKIKFIITEHDPFKLSKIKDLFKKWVLKNCSKIIAVSKENQKLLKKLYPNFSKKTIVIHNGLDIEWWNSQTLKFTEKDIIKIKTKTFHAHEDTLILTCISELHPRKGVDKLIKSLKNIVKIYSNVKLVIIGEGKESKNLKNLTKNLNLENHVTFLGRQSNIPQLLKSSNIFVLGSNREAFGFVNLEAMSCHLPIIAPEVGGIPEIIENQKNGLLYEKNDLRKLEKNIINLIQNSELRIKMGNEGYKILKEKFSAQKMSQEYEKIYEDVT